MWIFLKTNEPDSAWDQLIQAQSHSVGAIRAHRIAGALENYLHKLRIIEEVVFPPQTFVSVGGIVHSEECSICNSDYRKCHHIAGQVYMGQFCAIICRDVEPQEVSLVTEPADKRCRVTHFSEKGRKRNKMTWLLED